MLLNSIYIDRYNNNHFSPKTEKFLISQVFRQKSITITLFLLTKLFKTKFITQVIMLPFGSTSNWSRRSAWNSIIKCQYFEPSPSHTKLQAQVYPLTFDLKTFPGRKAYQNTATIGEIILDVLETVAIFNFHKITATRYHILLTQLIMNKFMKPLTFNFGPKFVKPCLRTENVWILERNATR